MRILHSMLRVADLEAALEFYTRALDMRLLRRRDYPEGRFTLAFVGYQDERAAVALELTHNWDRDGYTQGDGYGHLAIEVEDAAVTCAWARALGYRVTREAGPMQHGRSVIAFLEDPDGYKVELIQKGTQFD
ncbi:lactoylglutathione lyase [Pseudomonas aeruginosa]|uniref:lactoylglutathione lyase n=1 Tax=Pseudomonas aeruginosa TaxID=287 RepID=UPI00053D3436|nr:lactoylglutathione lyase [Pseudomonas aeruginosa]EIU1325285.1 lactoylglutathione lyase [Pseudomonas aeruginosa]EIU1325638.1 lactoylglutathione lyase [Pseudomonas aeruginosa]EKX8759326.1 lactoylglutathione lyase [Pseudomonas aeruginosa]EKX8764413.1 lactoylglutathione lyase [Pseudomonas aeruginosa]POP59710.1 lactoylglutathione lyase [Pseudomonas aeruginosa]